VLTQDDYRHVGRRIGQAENHCGLLVALWREVEDERLDVIIVGEALDGLRGPGFVLKSKSVLARIAMELRDTLAQSGILGDEKYPYAHAESCAGSSQFPSCGCGLAPLLLDACCGCRSGNRTLNFVPASFVDDTASSPPWAWTICEQM